MPRTHVDAVARSPLCRLVPQLSLAHTAWQGAPPHVLDQGDALLGDDELMRAHVAPYLPALAAGALSVMVSFSSVNGEPCHASRALITDLLKDRLGFGGIVISDYEAVNLLREPRR